PRLRKQTTLGFERGGEDANRALLCPQLIDEPHLMGRRHEVRRYHRELAAGAVYGFGYRSKLQAADALVALGEPLALVRAIGHYLGAGPVERRAAGEQAGEGLVRREALLIVLVGALCPLRHRHAPRQCLSRRGVGIFRRQQRLYRGRELALPVLFEGGGEPLNRGA